MSVPLYCLVVFAVWTLVLAVAVFLLRAPPVVTGDKKATDFPAGVPHGSEPYWRINRAHLNCTENIGIYAAVVLAAEVAGIQDGTLDLLAVTAVVCRLGQSSAHISSGSEAAVVVRASFFAVQVVCLFAFALQAVRLA